MMDEGYASCRQMFLDEIALLKAMFNDDELTLPEGERPLAEGRDTLIMLQLVINNMAVELVVQCSVEYPLYMKPSVLVRCNNADCDHLNQQLRAFIDSAQLGEPLIMNVVQWIQDNFLNFVIDRENEEQSKSNTNTSEQPEEEPFARYWIYSHHLRSNVKRKNIESIAKMLNLNGFSSPGKPGTIVIEGKRKDCQEFWERVRVWTWKHIALRHREESNKSEGFLCMDKFREIVFSSNDGRRIDLAELKKYLSEYGLEYGFRILLNM